MKTRYRVALVLEQYAVSEDETCEEVFEFRTLEDETVLECEDQEEARRRFKKTGSLDEE